MTVGFAEEQRANGVAVNSAAARRRDPHAGLEQSARPRCC